MLVTRAKCSGFTLIELIITVAIVAVLAAVALPSYTQYITQANRADAKDKITEVAYELERYNTRNRRYTDDMTQLGYAADPVQSDEGYYQVDVQDCDGGAINAADNCALITATPIAGGPQSGDGSLSLNTQGKKVGPW